MNGTIYKLAFSVGIVGVVLMIAGIIKQNHENNCLPTENSQRSSSPQLMAFIKKVQKTYYELYPNKIVYMPKTTVADIRTFFTAYDPSPRAIKMRTDIARKLYEEIDHIKFDLRSIPLREGRALAKVKHYLQSNFGTPYDENYYAGDWMMGPNYFCWQPICKIGSDLGAHFNTKTNGFQPKSIEDLEFVIRVIQKHGNALEQYVDNMKYGVKAGMVRSVKDCKSGLNSLSSKFPEISANTETAIYEETFIKNGIKHKDYLKKLDSSVQGAWRSKYGKTVEGSLNAALLNDLGKPIKAFIDYVKLNYSRHCIPDDKVSGLASLPVDYVWLDQREDKQQPTLKKLPTGEALNGPKAYEMILPYFTTNSMKANEIYDLGKRMLDSLYPQALEIAKAYTKESDSVKAAARFKAEFVDSPMSYFNATPIPANESGRDAFQKCQSLETAKKYCPVRYQSMMNWFGEVEAIMATLHAKIVNMFYQTGPKASTANCPVRMVAVFNPSVGHQSFSAAGARCRRPCYYKLPFFLTPPGPRYAAISIAGHEARPGHHTQ
ncbi:uncharacterized protein LOC135687446 isoform X2 [Rhopilema esculentum]